MPQNLYTRVMQMPAHQDTMIHGAHEAHAGSAAAFVGSLHHANPKLKAQHLGDSVLHIDTYMPKGITIAKLVVYVVYCRGVYKLLLQEMPQWEHTTPPSACKGLNTAGQSQHISCPCQSFTDTCTCPAPASTSHLWCNLASEAQDVQPPGHPILTQTPSNPLLPSLHTPQACSRAVCVKYGMPSLCTSTVCLAAHLFCWSTTSSSISFLKSDCLLFAAGL